MMTSVQALCPARGASGDSKGYLKAFAAIYTEVARAINAVNGAAKMARCRAVVARVPATFSLQSAAAHQLKLLRRGNSRPRPNLLFA
ncbi:hypothetical protein J2X76_003236 [Neorhizobium sp. 2083]|uniref:hypothetical protein n=1 Tax=Neorhizobium sp. 2083 TaxID=2817762 RepID=UPI002860567B|nr:hypothetical protein [Neorhizobium sp. 2083]MDR6818060.1 hypothetical protein [Neorhizobium sp. 2083]